MTVATPPVPRSAPGRDLAGLPDRLSPPMPSHGLRGWIGPLAVMAIGAVLRLWNLGQPHAIAFDETYYVKDALALLRFGYEQQAVEGADELILEQDAPWDQLDIFTADPSFVVHPPLGKLVIALGEWALWCPGNGLRHQLCTP